MATTYIVRRGETLSLYLEAVTGDPASASNVTVKLKPAVAGAAPPQSTAAIATLQVTAQPTSPGNDAGGVPIQPGWYAVLTAAQSAGLTPGAYFADAAFQVGAAQFVTDKIAVEVLDPISLP